MRSLMKVTEVSPLTIAGFTVPVEVENHHLQVAGLLGRYLGDEPRIVVRDDMSPQMVAQTTLHEVIHAVIGIYLEGHTDLSEHVIAMIAQGLFQVLQDNEALTQYISGGFEDEPTSCQGGDECPACVNSKCTNQTVMS